MADSQREWRTRCPWCNQPSPFQEDWRGRDIACPNPDCNGPLHVNTFLVGEVAAPPAAAMTVQTTPSTETDDRQTTLEAFARRCAASCTPSPSGPSWRGSSFTTGCSGTATPSPSASRTSGSGAAAPAPACGSTATADCGNPKPSSASSPTTRLDAERLRGEPRRRLDRLGQPRRYPEDLGTSPAALNGPPSPVTRNRC